MWGGSASDVATHKVEDVYGLLRSTLYVEAQMLGGDDIACLAVGVGDAEDGSEVGNEKGVLCDNNEAGVFGVVVVPAYK